ncbi:MAG: lipase family protein [Planctomycetaceae bacterium]
MSAGPLGLPADRSLRGLFAPKPDHDYFAAARDRPFQPAATRYESGNGWWLAEASLLAYVEEEAIVRAALGRAGLGETAIFERGAGRALAACGPAFAIVAFRGTRFGSWRDLEADLRVGRTRWMGPGKVHRGFHDALEGIRPDLAAWLARIDRPVWFTGHSLGAALATLAYARHRRDGLVTFGSPRVGNRSFARAFPPGAIRVVNGRDPIPTHPWPLLFRHVGELHRIGETPSPGPIPDHSPLHYALLAAHASARGVDSHGSDRFQ